MSATYICFWGDGYYKDGEQVVGPEFFTDDNGYNSEAQKSIAALQVRGKVDLSDLSGSHTVERID